MTIDYYVQNKSTKQLLNRQGSWSHHFGSYRLATFNSEADAKSAFPEGISCSVVTKRRREPEPADEKKFALARGNKFYDMNGNFQSPAAICKETVHFDSKDAALDKAEELGIHLDLIAVVTVPSTR